MRYLEYRGGKEERVKWQLASMSDMTVKCYQNSILEKYGLHSKGCLKQKPIYLNTEDI